MGGVGAEEDLAVEFELHDFVVSNNKLLVLALNLVHF